MGRLKLLEYAERLALGIVLEVSAFPKPGNVHRLQDFIDTIYEDFLITSIISIEPLHKGINRGYRYRDKLVRLKVVYGDIIYSLVSKSLHTSGGGNTCLGTSMMLTPIAVALGYDIASYGDLLVERTIKLSCKYLEQYSKPLDTVYLYRAIRVAAPSYIRKTDNTDHFPNVWSRSYRKEIILKNVTLWDVLRYSSSFDIIARDIVECYPRAHELSKYIFKRLSTHNMWNRAVVEAYLYQLSKEPDTLVVRKNGIDTALEVQKAAGKLLKICEDSWHNCIDELRRFDHSLASKGINPGSSADIVATAISIYSLTKWTNILRSK